MNPEHLKTENAHCKAFQTHAKVELLASDGGSNFKIEAYTGAVMDRWWGKLAIDVDGIKAKKHLPVFLNHDRASIVGHSSKVWANKSLFVEGTFSEVTEAAREVKALAAEGFPWQASIGVVPTKIERVKEGQTKAVNGLTVSGPAEIWTESEVFETSFVPLGADANTSVATFSEESDQSPESLARQRWNSNPELRSEFTSFDAFWAFERNIDRIKIIGGITKS